MIKSNKQPADNDHFSHVPFKKLIEKYQLISALNYYNTLAGWDTETYLPAQGVEERGRTLGVLAALIQDKYLDQDFRSALDAAKKVTAPNVYESAVLRVVGQAVDVYTKLPPAFVREFSDVTAKTSTVWAEARKQEAPQLFIPWLEKIFELTRQKAEFLGYKNEPYDAIFSMYEDDLTAADLVAYFAELKTFLLSVDLKHKKYPVSHLFKDLKFDRTRLEELNMKVLHYLGYDPGKFRLDVTAHPFSLFLAPGDIRLTTRYPETDFTASLFPCIHEFGHGLFASQTDPKLAETPLWPEVSYALHESQSRFWENMLGRSHGFLNKFREDFRTVNGLAELGADELWKALNSIEPSLIRVDADEISYHWHIIIRFEIERAVLNNEIKVKDIPEVWNSKYQEYLGITPDKPSNGFLQDIHWSFGSVGYFPSYSLGSVTSALWYDLLTKETGFDFNQELDQDKVLMLNEWFRNKVHKFAGTYTLKEIWQKHNGSGITSKPWINYIKKKYQLA